MTRFNPRWRHKCPEYFIAAAWDNCSGSIGCAKIKSSEKVKLSFRSVSSAYFQRNENIAKGLTHLQ